MYSLELFCYVFKVFTNFFKSLIYLCFKAFKLATDNYSQLLNLTAHC